MRVAKPIHFSRGLSVALMVAAAVTAFATVAPAAEGPNLPPAEYKPLPAGTIINYDIRTYTVQESRGFEIVVKESKQGYWQRPYAVFGRQGLDSYTFRVNDVWRDWAYDANFDDAGKSALESLWPLTVGKKVELEFGEIFQSTTSTGETRPWKLTLEVLRTEYLEIKGIRYPTFVVRAHAVSEDPQLVWANFPEQDYTETHWYNPDSGLVLKLQRDWIRGGTSDSNDQYNFVGVTYPKGTTTHALKGTPISGEAQTAKATTLPPAPYKPLLVGTRIKYDDRIYRVTKTDGFLTTYRSITGNKRSYLNAYALFGEYADDLYVFGSSGSVVYEIDSENRKKLEGFWPLEVGKKERFILNEGPGQAVGTDNWEITLEVSKAEVINLKGKNYKTYVIIERGRSDSGKIYVGRKWYHPLSGLIIKATRTWIKAFEIQGGGGGSKSPNFAEGEVDNYSLVKVKFPDGSTAVAETPASASPPTATESAPKVSAAEKARLKRKAEAKQKARTAELARLEREAEEKRQATARKAEAEQKALEVEVARLAREAEKAREAEEKAGTVAQKEIARLKREAAEAKKEIAAARAREAEMVLIREAEIARLKKEAAEAKARDAKARDAEFARLRQQLEEALKARKTAEAPKAKPKAADGLAGIDFGNYHALVIGINNYKNLPKLTTAINDAKGVAKVLKDEYGFKVTTLIDPDRLDIIDAFDELQETLTDEDNLLIYYAGHGWLNEDTDRGYWLPVDAKPKRRGGWVSNATITDTLKGLSAKHVMVLADNCYSGTLTRAADVGTRKRTGDYWKKMASKWARVAITSGGLEPVVDKGGGGHSPFAKAFIDVLQDNVSIMDGMQLFSKMRRPVMVAADQTPQYSDVRNAGHDGGDFLFVRKK